MQDVGHRVGGGLLCGQGVTCVGGSPKETGSFLARCVGLPGEAVCCLPSRDNMVVMPLPHFRSPRHQTPFLRARHLPPVKRRRP